jgi:hypothetical protein
MVNPFKELPHNTAAHLAVPFPTSAACRFLDLPPGSADPFSLKTVHWTVFRALEPSKPSKSAIASVEKFTRQLTTLIARYFLNIIANCRTWFNLFQVNTSYSVSD